MNADTRVKQTVEETPAECPACGSSEIDEHRTHVECIGCGWAADYDPIPCMKCENKADTILHGRFPLCTEHYHEVIRS